MRWLPVAKRMRAAYRTPDPLVAQAELEALARELDRSHPGAAGSLREGLAETLTIGRLGVPATLARTLRSTNSIESMIEICRDHAANVKRWRDGQMVLRWVAAGMAEAATQFRRVNGYLHLPTLGPPWTPPSPMSHRPRRMPPDHPLGRHRSSTASGTSSGAALIYLVRCQIVQWLALASPWSDATMSQVDRLADAVGSTTVDRQISGVASKPPLRDNCPMSTDRTSALPPGVDGVEIKVTLGAEMVERGRQAFRIGLAQAEPRSIWFAERPVRQGDSAELPLLSRGVIIRVRQREARTTTRP